MDYQLENLGPERFQEVCHALLAKAFPKTQCFPVAQPDGGRDAISYYPEHSSDDYIVYQVKYSRRPQAESKPHEWLKTIVADEAPKVRNLIGKGAKFYVILTNVPGTAHFESGAIDTVQGVLSENFAIPSQCWWRDDLNRRLDDAWDIKWSYPEILSGPDILRHIIESGLREDSQRRTSVIRAYLQDQMERDMEVRFKQVELQNKLLDLFIDVPVRLRESAQGRSARARDSGLLHAIARQHAFPGVPADQGVGTATVLLHSWTQKLITRVVIEGAPGQGKSTIAQYICQIHRQRVLNHCIDDERIPEAHRNNPVRLPIKVDCRDLSLWLNRKNPFGADDSEDVTPDWQKSVESFLAALISNYSGGAAFSVADLHAVLRVSAVLIVFDGLDEVADIPSRRQVVEQISKGINRLEAVAVAVQTVVTSRPAAFANSPGMPEDTFKYLHLGSIHRALIEQYAEKWLRARKLQGKEATDVRRILRDKLDQPHLRELARNPMQLAILLSLIQTRGGSLPDKRTSLYDSYVELFFNRESEKSTVVRDHRDLLIDIHRFLAWILHAESQTEKTRGSVSSERLRQLVTDYLTAEGRDPALARELFTGMVERVVALVSRVEGTYEFEVQPLREYFAARHLYNTAPYSPSGNPQTGTLPDRFDALSRDFYWQNVARFYAGCYSKGELPSLVERLEELARSQEYRFTSHPQLLAATLLSDWVFAQHPKSMKQVVALILSGASLRQIAGASGLYRRDEHLALPKENGNEELVASCFEQLLEGQPQDFAFILVDLIRENATREGALRYWTSALQNVGIEQKTNWVRYGGRLGVIPQLNDSSLGALMSDGLDAPERLLVLWRSGARNFVESDERRCQTMVDYLLERNPEPAIRRASSIVQIFLQSITSARYTVAFEHRNPIPLFMIRERVFGGTETENDSAADDISPTHEVERKCAAINQLAQKLGERASNDWVTELDPWDQLVECARSQFGDRWSFNLLANASAGIRSKVDLCEEASSLHDSGISLCRRARHARLRAGVPSWWATQINLATKASEMEFTLLLLLTWAGPSVLSRCAGLVDSRLESLSDDGWARLAEGLRIPNSALISDRRSSQVDPKSLPRSLSFRGIVAFSHRFAELRSFRDRLRSYDGDDRPILEFCQQTALGAAIDSPRDWQQWLPVISRSYMKGAASDRYFGHRLSRAIRGQSLPESVAQVIVEEGKAFPTELVALAERECRQRAAERVTPVGMVAATQNWFRL